MAMHLAIGQTSGFAGVERGVEDRLKVGSREVRAFGQNEAPVGHVGCILRQGRLRQKGKGKADSQSKNTHRTLLLEPFPRCHARPTRAMSRNGGFPIPLAVLNSFFTLWADGAGTECGAGGRVNSTDRLVKERRARLAAERLLDQKARELLEANSRLSDHARNLVGGGCRTAPGPGAGKDRDARRCGAATVRSSRIWNARRPPLSWPSVSCGKRWRRSATGSRFLTPTCG